MSPLLDSGSHGLRPVRNPLISGPLQQRGKKLLVEPDSHNRAGPPPDWGAAQESHGAAAEGRNQPQPRQPRPGSARRSRDVRGEGAHPRQYRIRNSVTKSSPQPQHATARQRD